MGAGQDRLAGDPFEGQDFDALVEQSAIDVRKAPQQLVERLRPRIQRRVDHLEQVRQLRAELGAVGLLARLDELLEQPALPHAGVVAEHQEQQPHHEHRGVVAFVAVGGQQLVQPAHEPGGVLVGLRLLLAPEPAGAVAGDEAEAVDFLGPCGP